ncbi:hypothetical protein [Candidatus Leptofilum sp.]|uniref:hypothetical protein n=1 Tax=Candidatus Leptofilum sp. TaxID=3241576 RepID=UPI003B5987B2
MGFLEANINLDGTKFNHAILLAAQKYLVEAIQFHDPEWLDKPEGPLSWYWNREDIESVCFLINFADTLGRLRKNITEKSITTYIKKFKELLQTKKENQFEETLLELRFARALCELVSPISFEPFVPQETKALGQQPRSPDYAMRLPDGDIQIEVTTFHFGALESWNLATKHLSKQLSHLLEKHKISRVIEIAFPLEFNSISLLPRKFLEDLADEICLSTSGSRQIMIRHKTGTLTWKPFLLLDDESQIFKEATDEEISTVSSFAYGFQKRLVKENHDELFLKSLRNTLNKKRSQRAKSLPYLLVLGLSHYSITVEGVMTAVRERIWPNPNYEWLTGLLIFTPASGFLESDPLPTLNYSFNPNARIPPTEALNEMLKNDARFHLRNGVFCSH